MTQCIVDDTELSGYTAGKAGFPVILSPLTLSVPVKIMETATKVRRQELGESEIELCCSFVWPG